MQTPRAQGRVVATLRRVVPWIIGIAILALVLTRIPFASFRAAIERGSYGKLAIVDLALALIVLGTDSVATWIGLIAVKLRRPLGKVIAVRGATYILFLINNTIGQGGFGYYLHRSGAEPLRAVGATLFLIGTNFATLLVVTTIAWAWLGADVPDRTTWWTLLVGCAALAAYLIVIEIAPRFVADRKVLAPLFDAGLGGHATAMLARVPHIAIMVIGLWISMRAWGLAVPFVDGLLILPIVVFATVLPISPGGLGTTQAAMVYFFADDAAGATQDDRAASVLAFSVVHLVYAVAASIVIGLACAAIVARAERRAARAERQTAEAAVSADERP